MEEKMKTLRIYYFKEADSMDIWLDEPAREHTSEEINDHTLIKRQRRQFLHLSTAILKSPNRFL